jgi:2,3-bisphosphoglycerate-independent phosphoglycerate mutase
VPRSLVESLVIENTTRIVLLVMDGLGDIPSEPRGWVTPLEAARTPNFDALTPRCALGRILPVAPGITPGSGPGHLALFGYDPVETAVGRGVLEAIGAGFELKHGDVAARANFCTVDGGGVITDRRAGRIPTEECTRLVGLLAEKVRRIEDVEILLRAGKGHRFVVVLRGPGLAGDVTDADPHKEGRRIPPVTPLGDAPGSAKTARIANAFVEQAAALLRAERPANAALLRGLSARPQFPGFRERFKLRAAALAAYPMYRGVAQLAGMEVLPVGGETPLDAFAAAKQAWNEHDFFFIHVKGTDQAGEDGNFDAKVATIEAVDQALPALLALEPDVLCVTGDHSTPVPVKQHSWHPVPTLVCAPLCGADRAPRFHEHAARTGSLGVLASHDLMAVLLANAGRLDKYGA